MSQLAVSEIRCFDHCKAEFCLSYFKNSGLSDHTEVASVCININRLRMFMELIAVYPESLSGSMALRLLANVLLLILRHLAVGSSEAHEKPVSIGGIVTGI